MQFYQDFELITKSNQDIDSESTFKIPSNEEVQALIGKDLQKGDEITKVTLHIKLIGLPHDYSKAVLHLKVHTKMYGKIDQLYIAGCELNTISNNCSAVQITNFSTQYWKKGLGKLFMNMILDWLNRARYTLVIGNTAATQNEYLPFFYKMGFVESNINYMNRRNNHKNIWIFKLLENT